MEIKSSSWSICTDCMVDEVTEEENFGRILQPLQITMRIEEPKWLHLGGSKLGINEAGMACAALVKDICFRISSYW